MRVRLCLLLSLLGAACVDLSRPPELASPRPGPADAEGSPGASPDAAVDAGAGVDAPAPVIADAGAGADLPAPADTTVEPIPPDAAAPDVGVLPADAAALPKDSAPLPADAAPLPPDAAPLPPDLAPDLAPPPPDLARDLAPDLAPPPPDLAPDLAPDAGPPPLVIDDFQTATLMTRNNLNSEVTWDHENCTRANGEMTCSYAGSGGYHDFIESLANWCSYDASKYRKVRFRMRTSVAGEQVDVFVLRHPTGLCNGSLVLVGTITTTTVMTTYELDLTAILNTAKWLTAIEFDPKSTSSAQFIYDDLQLVP